MSMSGSAALLDRHGPALRARCWGTRGSLPSPGRNTVQFGGNTSCVEVIGPDGERLVFDAGSGIRLLGEELGRSSEPVRVDLFMTHFHWDHIQGLPFFAPMYDATTTLRVHGARQDSGDVQSLIAGQMGAAYFPVPFDAVAASLEFRHLEEGVEVDSGSMRVSSHRLRHPGNTLGYRVDGPGGSVVYMPDNELVGGPHEAAPGWRDSLCRFVDGADILFHDSMFTDAEYARYEGWGHSSIPQAVRLAEDAGVRRLCLFHHSPGRTDAELVRILDDAREDLARRGSGLEIGIAAEGEELVIEVST